MFAPIVTKKAGDPSARASDTESRGSGFVFSIHHSTTTSEYPGKGGFVPT